MLSHKREVAAFNQAPFLTAAHSLHLVSYRTSLRKQCASNPRLISAARGEEANCEFIIVRFDERRIH